MTVKGWCPGALRPMESGDGLIVRLRITGGIVPLRLAGEIARWSTDWGNGEIDLTSRANLQLRGVSSGSLPFLQAALAGAGLLDGDAGGEAVRNVIASPLAGIDPTALLDVRRLAVALEDRLGGDAALHALPAKFGFVIDDGGCLPLHGVRADVRFQAVAGPAFAVGLDGDDAWFGPVGRERLVETAAALAGAFLGRRDPDDRRMRDLVARVGAKAVAAESGLSASPLEGEVGNGFALPGGGAGAPIGIFDMRHRNPPTAATHVASTSPSRAEALVLGVGLPFGRISADQLSRLAASAPAHGAIELRLAPWRAILIPLPALTNAAALSAQLALTDLILDLADPRLHAAACTGAPGCANATTPTRADATRLSALLVSEPGIALHVSGCAKGCAHPHSAPITLVGNQGRYDLVHNGRAADSPQRTGLTLDEAAGHLREMAATYSRGGTA